MRRSRIVLLAAAGALVAGPLASHALAATRPAFAPVVQLSGHDAGGNPTTGGEPSIAADPWGNVVVTGPQGIPSGVNGTPGVAVWVSHDGARSFAPGTLHGSYLGGGDSDVSVTPDGTFYIADLEAAAAAVCRSGDHARTWSSIGPVPDPGGCGGVVVGQAGPSNDREWLTTDGNSRLYLTYHEFVSAQPVMFRDDHAGNDLFADGPCGPIVTDPSIEANVPTDVTGGTLVSKPVVDRHGNLYVMFTTTTQQENISGLVANQQPSGSFSQIYLAVSTDHCQTFTDHVVFDGSRLGTNTVQFGDIFNSLAVDGADNLYAVAAGYVGKTAYPPTASVFVLSSHDHGAHWTAPYRVTGPREADMLPAAVGGPRAGDLAIGYFRTVNQVTDPNATKAQWTYEVGISTDATSAAPSFAEAPVATAGGQPYVFHHGDICNEGILCGIAPGSNGDRSLLDFTSATLQPGGCPVFTFAGNPSGTNDPQHTFNYVARQTAGCF